MSVPANIRVAHTADWHISRNADKCEEARRCICAMLAHYWTSPPDLFVLAGDTVDLLDGHIDIHSEAAECVLDLVQKFASLAPVAIVRGTKSHDRNAPAIFRRLHTQYPVHVSTQVEQVALMVNGSHRYFVPSDVAAIRGYEHECLAVLTMVPSLDKAYFNSETIADGNRQYRELIHDLFAGLGLVNDSLPINIPKIFVGHGMMTGSVFSTGQSAIGEDMEFSINDLHAAGCDVVCLGHVHKYQQHGGNIFYSGSPGRLNFGEIEDKGFLEHHLSLGRLSGSEFIHLPARKFHFVESHIESDMAVADYVAKAVADAIAGADGADVRLRFDVPEECRNTVDRDAIEQALVEAGARKVKIEMQVIPKTRQRAAGISRASSLPEKLQKWSDAVCEPVPTSVMALAGRIEGLTVEELLAGALDVPVEREKVAPAAVASDLHIFKRDVPSCDSMVQGGLF